MQTVLDILCLKVFKFCFWMRKNYVIWTNGVIECKMDSELYDVFWDIMNFWEENRLKVQFKGEKKTSDEEKKRKKNQGKENKSLFFWKEEVVTTCITKTENRGNAGVIRQMCMRCRCNGQVYSVDIQIKTDVYYVDHWTMCMYVRKKVWSCTDLSDCRLEVEVIRKTESIETEGGGVGGAESGCGWAEFREGRKKEKKNPLTPASWIQATFTRHICEYIKDSDSLKVKERDRNKGRIWGLKGWR